MCRILTATAALAIALWSTTASATPIVYSVSRTVGAGSAVGTITTDGTLGALTATNIVDWTLTLTSANLAGGSPQVITKATAIQTLEFGGFLSASASAISTGYASM